MEYRKIEPEELKQILEDHSKWLNDEGGKQANLRSVDLSYANLRSVDLRSANLRFANLSSANLRFANLSSADLRDADLRYANLSSVDLRDANLSSANLRSANLLVFTGPRHVGYFTQKDGMLRLGCLFYHIERWASDFEDIGEAHGYSPEQIEIYGSWIFMCLGLVLPEEIAGE